MYSVDFVLGPALFFLYINDIKEKIQSNTSLYAFNTIVYNKINSINDHSILQEDLYTQSEWTTTWLMDFNICKCAILPITKKRKACFSIILSLVILYNMLMNMSILGFQLHMIFVALQ